MSANLIVIPTPGMGHLIPAMNLAKQLVSREPRLSITFLIIINDQHLQSSLFNNNNIRFKETLESKLKESLQELIRSSNVAGVLIDMLQSSMIDVATDLGIPSYVFVTSGASHLRTLFHLQQMGNRVSPEEYDVVRDPDKALEIPGFQYPVPVKVWPGSMATQAGSSPFLLHPQRYRRATAILLNTFSDFEPEKLESLSQDKTIPPIYPVGPILTVSNDDEDHDSASTMRWLDSQPPQSVVFLCFGSRGSFNETQVKEMAIGLERSGRRFLWSLREGSAPSGFVDRTKERGRVIGWAPQSMILRHVAVGVFVSHCGWNSTLESVWNGVPIAAWPIYAEQQLNAFVLVREMELAAEIRVDYRQDLGDDVVVEAEEIEEAIRKAMGVRRKVEEMRDKANKAVREGGTSYDSFGRFIKLVFDNVP